jgi:hypothetical protein
MTDYSYGGYYPQPQMPMNQMQSPQIQTPQLQQPQQSQDSSFTVMRVPTVKDAREYPIAPGNGLTFFIENEPYICCKTLGNSGMEQPRFKKWRLTEESDDGSEVAEKKVDPIAYVAKEEHEKELGVLKDHIDQLEKAVSEIRTLKDRLKKMEDAAKARKRKLAEIEDDE